MHKVTTVLSRCGSVLVTQLKTLTDQHEEMRLACGKTIPRIPKVCIYICVCELHSLNAAQHLLSLWTDRAYRITTILGAGRGTYKDRNNNGH